MTTSTEGIHNSVASDQAAPGRHTAAEPGVVICRDCRRPNPASRRFCGGCGQPLWETCPQCQAECAADERFCGACGADVAGSRAALAQQLAEQLAQAASLAAAFDYGAAIACLRDAAATSDARCSREAQQARAEISRLQALHQKQVAAAQTALARGRQALAEQAYDRAVHELQQIPAPLCSAEAAALLARARSAREELHALGAEIRAAVEARQTGNLLPKVERLLALRPGHKQALALAGQLREQIVRAAKKSLARHQYRQALEGLAQVSASARSPEVETLADTAAELLALQEAIEHSPLADRQTLALADRLARLAPTNGAAAELRAKVAERMRVHPADPRLGGPSFAPPPKRTQLGPPVDWLTSPARLAPADERVAAALAEHPGRFWVAIGLALQALDLAAIPMNLTPPEKTSVLFTKLPGLSLGNPATAAWGLDLSDESLKAVKLARSPQTGVVQIVSCQLLVHGTRLLELSDDLQRPEIIGRTLQRLIRQCGELRGARIAVALPSRRVLGRFFDLPPLPHKKVADAINYEARHQLPMALDELCWQSRVLSEGSGPVGDESARHILIVAARQSHVRERLAEFRASGVCPDIVTSDCLALHNAIAYELFGEAAPTDQQKAVCAVDVGAAATNIVVSSRDRVWFRTSGQGGNTFESLLVEKLNVTRVQAETLLRQPAKSRRYSEWSAALQPGFAQLTDEVQRSLVAWAKVGRGRQVDHIYGLGGSFSTHGILRYLRNGY